jgi:hypothetical protein
VAIKTQTIFTSSIVVVTVLALPHLVAWVLLENRSAIPNLAGDRLALLLFVSLFLTGCLAVSYWVFRVLYLRLHPAGVLIIAFLAGIPTGVANCYLGLFWMFYFFPPVGG